MSACPDGAFSACMQFATQQARTWVPRWIEQLNAVLYQRETAASSFHEKQSFGNARAVLVSYREQVAGRLLGEIGLLASDAEANQSAMGSARKKLPLSLDELSLEDHGEAQAKVALARVQQVVKMASEEAEANLNVFLSRARGLDMVRSDVNPLSPDAIVAALARALATLHVDDGVRTTWMNTGAVPLGGELKAFYDAMAKMLAESGVEPAGYLMVQRPDMLSPVAIAKARKLAETERGQGDSMPMSAALAGQGPQLSLDQLQALLGSTLSAAGSGAEGSALASPLAAQVVTQMMRRVADDRRLLPTLRNLVQGLHPALLQLAHNEPRFFADPANPARLLLDAITLQGSAFFSEQDAGFMAFAERTQRVLNALQSGPAELPGRLKASLSRFLSVAGGADAADGGQEEEPPQFMDTQPMAREAMLVESAPHP